jgi:hypothetical protein
MAMQTDVQAVQVTSTNTAYAAPTRIKGLTISFASGGTVVLKDGGSGGTTRYSFTAPAAAGAVNVLLPGQGIKFDTDVHATLANATIVVFYG